MLKLFGGVIDKPLRLIYSACLDQEIFPLYWKKAKVVPINKKNKKQSVENYRPVIVLPLCEKALEGLLYNNMFSFFIENDLIFQNQSGFKPDDYCINQPMSITHEIYKSFDDSWEERIIFLHKSKAVDKVWHEGLLLKLKIKGISGNLLKIMKDFLANRYEKAVLKGQVS